MKYTTLFLDLDNTLLDFYKAEAVAIRKVLKKYALPYDDNAVSIYSNINRSYWERFERGEILREEIFTGRFKTLLETFGTIADIEGMSKDYFNELSNGYFVIDGAKEILEYLKAKGYNLYATTNGVALTQYKRIENSGLGIFFDKVFISEETGCQKPEKRFFDFVIENIPEKDRSKILILGDSQSSDILGGINSGIDSCWYNRDKKEPIYKSEYEIKELLELKDFL